MRTESGTCVLILLLFATPFFVQTAVLHSATEDSLTVRAAVRVCLSEMLIMLQGMIARHRAWKQNTKSSRCAKLFGRAAHLLIWLPPTQGPSAVQGGAIGCFKPGATGQAPRETGIRMRVDEISDVIRTRQDWILLQVTDRAEKK
jgi:hypothetical protein